MFPVDIYHSKTKQIMVGIHVNIYYTNMYYMYMYYTICACIYVNSVYVYLLYYSLCTICILNHSPYSYYTYYIYTDVIRSSRLSIYNTCSGTHTKHTPPRRGGTCVSLCNRTRGGGACVYTTQTNTTTR